MKPVKCPQCGTEQIAGKWASREDKENGSGRMVRMMFIPWLPSKELRRKTLAGMNRRAGDLPDALNEMAAQERAESAAFGRRRLRLLPTPPP